MTIRNRPESDRMGIPDLGEKFRVRSTSINLRASERRLLLAVVDFLLLILALVASLEIATGLQTTIIGLLGAWKWFPGVGIDP